MNFEEHAAKPLLAAAGLAVPRSRLVELADEAADAARALGRVAVKAQAPTGKRGKAGGVRFAATPDEAAAAAAAILGTEIGGHRIRRVLVEEAVDIARELYAAVLADAAAKGPVILFSLQGGMDIEETASRDPAAIRRIPVDILAGADRAAIAAALAGLETGVAAETLASFLARLYGVWRDNDAELLEINPLAVTGDGRLVALDCKLTLDDSAAPRREILAGLAAPEKLSALERKAAALGLKFIELDGDIGILANGAGLTMTTMDVVSHYGGRPANVLEIGGDAYTKATPALELVLANPGIRSLVVNFCGAFARTDVMTGGVIEAFEALSPKVPFFFCIHGTGADEARAMLKDRLGMECYALMDDAIRAAIEAAS
jgi:succinyl-CoA synthetase beta subunit